MSSGTLGFPGLTERVIATGTLERVVVGMGTAPKERKERIEPAVV